MGLEDVLGMGARFRFTWGDVNEFCPFDLGVKVRWVRISEKAMRCVSDDWGWELTGTGKWEVVGEGHEFEDEVLWIQCLDLSRWSQAFHRDRLG